MADEAAAVKHNNEVGNKFDHKVDSSKSIVSYDGFSYMRNGSPILNSIMQLMLNLSKMVWVRLLLWYVQFFFCCFWNVDACQMCISLEYCYLNIEPQKPEFNEDNIRIDKKCQTHMQTYRKTCVTWSIQVLLFFSKIKQKTVIAWANGEFPSVNKRLSF